MALAGCGASAPFGTVGTIVPGGEFGATHAGNAKRPRPHQGTDFMIQRAAKVIAVADGELTAAVHRADPEKQKKRFSTGRKVEIIHTGHVNGMRTVYVHLGKVYVNFGDTVRAGQVIATVGQCSTGPPRCGDHLHFETIDNYMRKNPVTVIAGCFSKGEGILTEERSLFHPLKC